MALGNETSLDADLHIVAGVNEPIPSPTKDADLIAADANEPIPSPAEDADLDDVIVIPSDYDEANVNKPIPLPVEDADVEIAPHHNPFFNPKLFNRKWDDVIVVPSDDDKAYAEEDISTFVNTQAHGVSHSNGDTTNTPSLVIGDDCVNQEDYSCCLNGKLIKTSSDFVVDGLVSWVEVEGIPLKVRMDNTFKRIASKWGTLLSIDNSEEDCYHNKCMCISRLIWLTYLSRSRLSTRVKLFGYGLKKCREPEDDIFGGVDKPNTDNREEEFEDENVVPDMVFDDGSVNLLLLRILVAIKELNCDNLNEGASNQGDHVNAGIHNSYSKREGTESVGLGHFKKGDALHTGGSILTVMDELIKVGQTVGFKMDGCMKNIE
nr:nucleotide-binding alpha-beta plait domain-containing protein [Tanacetum cinerariifolium]